MERVVDVAKLLAKTRLDLKTEKNAKLAFVFVLNKIENKWNPLTSMV